MRTLLFALVGAVAVSSVAVGFDPGRHHGPPDPAVVAQKLGEHLSLDETTQETIEAILEGARADAEPMVARIKSLYGELVDERSQEVPNDKVVRRLVKEIASARADIALHKMATTDEIASLLTPEQAEQFRQLREMRRAHEMRQRRGQASPPPEFFDDL